MSASNQSLRFILSLRLRVRKQPIIALYFESETVLKSYNPEARSMSRMNRVFADGTSHFVGFI